jgi:hypothetical protein
MSCIPDLEVLKKYLTTAQIAHLLSKHPSAVIRWVLHGKLLSTGQRLKLQAIRDPAGWRVAPEWLDTFLQAITADRLGEPVQAPTESGEIRSPTKRQRDHERAKRELQSSGFKTGR